MPWPPRVDGLLPRYDEPVGIEDSADDEVLDYIPEVATEDLRLVSKAPSRD